MDLPPGLRVGELVLSGERRGSLVPLAQDVDTGDLHLQVGCDLEVGLELLALRITHLLLERGDLVDVPGLERGAVAVEELTDGGLVAVLLPGPGHRLPEQPRRVAGRWCRRGGLGRVRSGLRLLGRRRLTQGLW